MDVMEIAKQRRANLARELSKLDEFIRVGEELTRRAEAKPATAGDDAKRPEAEKNGGPATVRQFSSENIAAKSG